MTPAPEQKDSLASLEERIIKTVQVISELRQEREIIMRDLEAAIAASKSLEEELSLIRHENELLRAEHTMVKARIQKVLGQLERLDNSVNS